MFALINGRLSIPARLTVLCLLFCVPALAALGLLACQGWKDLAAVQRELTGAAYLQSIWPQISAATTGGGGQSASDAEAEAKFGAAEAATSFRRALGSQERLAAGAALIGAVADGAGLTLDPGLDSFYTQDVLVVRLPAILVAADGLNGAVAEISPDRSVDVAAALARFNDAANVADSTFNSAIRDNAAGFTSGALAEPQSSLKSAATQLSIAGKAAEALPAPGAMNDTAQAALHTAVDMAWGASSTELVRLLSQRRSQITRNLALELGLSLTALALAALTTAVVARGWSGRIAMQVEAMERLAANDAGVAIPGLEDRNETGRIAASLERLKARLVEQARLKDDAARQQEASAERLLQVQASFKGSVDEQVQAVALLSQAMAGLAGGDLTVAVGAQAPAEYAGLAADFNTAVDRLSVILAQVRGSTQEITAGSEEIARASDNLSRRTGQQAASLEQTAAALDQVTAGVKKTASGARQAGEVVTVAKGEALRSGDVVSGAMLAMGEIEKSSRQISQIIGVIDEIAFQTNLLALNAGVEAARAGDAGRGFAVVAQEVRALAQRSADAAKQIKALISASSAQVGQGVSLVGQTGEVLRTIVGRVTEIDALVGEIAASANALVTGLAEVDSAVNQMDEAAQQNAAMMEQSTEATHNLMGETAELARLVAHFKLEEPPFFQQPTRPSRLTVETRQQKQFRRNI